MSKPTKAQKAAHPWSRDALLAKAQRYAQEMLRYSRDDWRFGLASTLVLEFLARAALANVHPTLLAEAKDWHNTLFALGHTPQAKRYEPRSLDTRAVMARLRELLPTFTEELEASAARHINLRNEELHSGLTPFDGRPTKWIGGYYKICSVLLKAVGQNLTFLVGAAEAKVAQKLINAASDASAKAVLKSVAAHKKRWGAKGSKERDRLSAQAAIWATRQNGHRVECPSCNSEALVVGEPVAPPLRRLDGDMIVEVQDHLPGRFECVACQLKISGLSKLSAVGLDATYKSTSTFSARELYAPEDDYKGYEDDNNEP